MKTSLGLAVSIFVFGCAHAAETPAAPAASTQPTDSAAPVAPAPAPTAAVDGSGITGTIQGQPFVSKVLLAQLDPDPDHKNAVEITIYQGDVACGSESWNDKYTAVLTLPMKKGYKVTFKDHSCEAAEGSDPDDMYNTICFDQETFSLREFPESGGAELLSVPAGVGGKGRIRLTDAVGEKGSKLSGEADFLLCPPPKS